MLVSLGGPVLVLMALAVLVARGLERLLPETLWGMALGFVLSSVILWAVASALFAVLYTVRAADIAPLLGHGDGLRHMAGLGLKAALIWGPLIAITVITAPQRWRVNRW